VAVKGPGRPEALGVALDRGSAVPLNLQLEDQLTWLIASGAVAPGDRLPSIRAFGAALGIHHHTVRQVYRELGGRGLIELRQGAAATVAEFSGLGLARPRSSTAMSAWGVLIPGHTPFYLPFLRAVERVAAESRALTVVAVTENNHVKAQLAMQEMIAAGVRGIIAASMGKLVEDEVASDRVGTAIPAVYCDQPVQDEESIVFDDAGAGYALAAHMGGHGHRRITLLTPTLEYPNMAAVHRGFRRVVDDGLLEGVDILESAGFDIGAGRESGGAALSGTDPPSAIVTTSDELALGVLASARSHGLRVPGDLALASYGAIDASEFVEPPITTVALPTEEMGTQAARRLVARIGGAPAEGKTNLTSTLVVRDSCGPHDPSAEPRPA
jgi:LacI family transcriptional regulator